MKLLQPGILGPFEPFRTVSDLHSSALTLDIVMSPITNIQLAPDGPLKVRASHWSSGYVTDEAIPGTEYAEVDFGWIAHQP